MSRFSQIIDELDLRDATPDDYPNGVRGYVQGIYGNGEHFRQVMVTLALDVQGAGYTDLADFSANGSLDSLDIMLEFIDTF
jgi:hypothetical protein